MSLRIRLHVGAQSLQSCLILWDPMNCSPPGSSVHGILQARILEWVAIRSSRGSSWPRDWTHISWVSCIVGKLFTHWATWEASVQFSRSVVSDSLRPHGLQHARLLCRSPTPGAYSNLCPLSHWCHPTISSSVVPLSSCLQFSQHEGLFQWVGSSHQVAKVLTFQFQHQYFQWIFRTDFL